MIMIRKFRRKFSISAPRLAVRPHVPWYLRWALTIPFIVGAATMVWWAYDSGLELAGFHRGQAERELDTLRDRVSFLEGENTRLSNEMAARDRQLQIEHAAMMETANQVKSLTDENASLKEDLSFFQNLPLTAGRETDLSIHRLKVDSGALPGEFHCRLLLVQNVQQRAKEFQGSMQLLASGEQDGKKVVLQFPQSNNAADVAAHQLSFKYYQRIDRTFTIPADVHLESVEVRVYEKGASEPKVKQTIEMG